MLQDIPIIFSKNYVNEGDILSATSGSPSLPYIHDRDKVSTWQSVGSNDTVQEVVTVAFYVNGVLTDTTFDSLFLLNHNLKDFDLQWSADGSSWNTIAITVQTANASADLFFDLRVAEGGPGPITAKYIRIRANKTIVANQDKSIAEFVVALRQYQLEDPMNAYSIRHRQAVRDVEMGDGSIDRTVILHDTNSYQKFEADINLMWRSTNERNTLKAIKDDGSPFLWWGEPVSVVRDLFFVRWENPWNEEYSDVVKGSGKTFNIQIREI